MQWLETHGQELESAYPYHATDGSCKYDSAKGKVKSTSVHSVTKNSVSQLKAAIQNGPTAVAVQANTTPFGHYSGGIINTSACGTNTDHAIVAVGYAENYYIVRNSWGTGWGEKGYGRIAAVEGAGICGIQTNPVYPSTN